ncbi:glycoside hydrolase family 63 protein [[Candida] arabinofermentans NRRL YB-2248]|uniref:Mannosyl-oligosaccharide glucosidase n=1 Tax=[Candida] arabinofermentans NRRL YB-2248 TaxID=983967 RepID=A0A1E4T6D7_9ASCO|nr:glycoside hydrolase family 63 protein [[Candida] arabinofermentans NRRL YB-2248]
MLGRNTLALLCILLTYVCAIEYGSLGDPEDIQSVIDNYSSSNEKSLLWGPYRSNLYLGVKPRIPESLLTGLMWFNIEDYQSITKMRHECKQSDNLDKYGWVNYDPRIGGRQVINDGEFKVRFTTDFVKNDEGNWALRIKGKTDDQTVKTSVVFYAGLESEGALKFGGMKDNINLVENDVKLLGFSDRLDGGFDIDIVDSKKNTYVTTSQLIDPSFDPSKTHHMSLNAPIANMWRSKEIFMTILRENVEKLQKEFSHVKDVPPEQLFQLINPANFEGNLHFIQKTFQGDFQFDILYNKELSEDKYTKENIGGKIQHALESFDKKFIDKFQLSAPFNGVNFVNFGKEILSQLLGGISYFYGDQLVDRQAAVDDVEFSQTTLVGKSEGPYELFTSIPSRPFFPRGFYWDEGFHLLPILEFDSDLALEIVKSWFSLIDEDGWIAREQILGDEARSKVPAEFTVQNSNIANPPTLMMVFSEILDVAKRRKSEDKISFSDQEEDFKLGEEKLGDLHLKNPDLLISYAEEIYPQLQKHFEWFRRTQVGEVTDFDRKCHSKLDAFRWKGRTKDHCLPSGIDDYPRAIADIAELNVDLMAWMGVMARSMYQISFLLENRADAQKYSRIYSDIVANLDDLHWSEKDQSYCDLTVDDDDENVFECHIGYVTLMPFIHRLIPSTSSHLAPIIKAITDPEQLWSDYGIRSLSKKDSKFHEGEDYWRGNIWVNINYLVLESLQHYASDPNVDSETAELAKKAYADLRKNLITNIYNQYEATGYAWEQYNERTGEGQKTKHFLGWTSLVVVMMKMPETIE